MSDYADRLSRREILKHSAVATGTLVAGGAAASGTAAAGIGDSRVLDYHLNNINYDRDRGEIVSNFVHDASPADNDGVWEGGDDPIVNGPVGNAFAFDGGERIELPEFSWGGGPVTVAFWNYVAEDDVQRSSAFGWGTQRGTENRLQVHAPWSDRQLYWDYGNTGKGRISTDYTDYLGEWTHIAVSSKGGNGSWKAIYLDGETVASAEESGEPSAGQKPFFIGQWAYGNHIGNIDEFRIYDRVLSDAEIQELASMDDD